MRSIFHSIHLYKEVLMRLLIHLLLSIMALEALSLRLQAQSLTTGTLQLRNAQPSTIGLTIPSTGVTTYSLALPSAIGETGQVMTIQTVTGTTATLGWSSTNYWSLNGSDVTAGGVATGQQYLGTRNAQDLVIASNATEAIRVIGLAGPSQGWIGLGTPAPRAPIDLARTVLLSNTGSATELRFAEPSASGTNYTAFRATSQAGDVTYTLPEQAPAVAGMVLASTATGVMSWRSAIAEVARGVFVPTAGNHIQTITAGVDIPTGAIPIVTMINAAGTTISISVTTVDTAADTFTVETSTPLAATDRIAWMILPPM
jgi:hypothetical protein